MLVHSKIASCLNFKKPFYMRHATACGNSKTLKICDAKLAMVSGSLECPYVLGGRPPDGTCWTTKRLKLVLQSVYLSFAKSVSLAR
jgi:hypothetical protein